MFYPVVVVFLVQNTKGFGFEVCLTRAPWFVLLSPLRLWAVKEANHTCGKKNGHRQRELGVVITRHIFGELVAISAIVQALIKGASLTLAGYPPILRVCCRPHHLRRSLYFFSATTAPEAGFPTPTRIGGGGQPLTVMRSGRCVPRAGHGWPSTSGRLTSTPGEVSDLFVNKA